MLLPLPAACPVPRPAPPFEIPRKWQRVLWQVVRRHHWFQGLESASHQPFQQRSAPPPTTSNAWCRGSLTS